MREITSVDKMEVIQTTTVGILREETPARIDTLKYT